MATLDGLPVSVGDTVFAVGYGRGKVNQTMSEGRMMVRFEVNGKMAVFDSGGVQSRNPYRSLFWKDPVVIPPLKDDAKWDRLRPVAAALVAAFTTYG